MPTSRQCRTVWPGYVGPSSHHKFKGKLMDIHVIYACITPVHHHNYFDLVLDSVMVMSPVYM